ncbi:MAG: hypothetical protein JW939_06935, partial [Candidatus Thermoplasmatota archaeon]|nr:hypothetical protein [Candidatus Thermoplasmatota archaeon]
IAWGGPDSEYDKVVDVYDNSQLPNVGDRKIGTVTAPNGGTFSYSKFFKYGTGSAANTYYYNAGGTHVYGNTARITDDGSLETASATLTVYVQSYLYETAYAKGSNYYGGTQKAKTVQDFCPTYFSQWGWTNKIDSTGSYKWPLYAGAAQCVVSNGFLIGYVIVSYSASSPYIDVDYHIDQEYHVRETHVYAGLTMFPQVNDQNTVSPGQYYIDNTITGTQTIWIIAHAVIGYADPNFGPPS